MHNHFNSRLLMDSKIYWEKTSGNGRTEVRRSTWVLSSPACAKVNNAMQQFTSLHYTTNKQHKDVTHAGMAKDPQGISASSSY